MELAPPRILYIPGSAQPEDPNSITATFKHTVSFHASTHHLHVSSPFSSSTPPELIQPKPKQPINNPELMKQSGVGKFCCKVWDCVRSLSFQFCKCIGPAQTDSSKASIVNAICT